MIILKWVVGIFIGIAIIISLYDWNKEREFSIQSFVATIMLVLVEIVIIKG